MSLKAVLFDFDGTLADSNKLITDSFLHVLNPAFPGKYDEESVQQFNGPSLDAVLRELFPKNSEEMIEKYRTYNSNHHDELLTTFPNVKESLETLQKAGLKLAIVSTKSNVNLIRGLDLLNLTTYFDVIVGNSDYTHFKPHPEPLEVAMNALKVDAPDCIMVGDNSHDIEAAHNAGVTSVFVTWSKKSEKEIAKYNPNKKTHSMLELTQWILEKYDGGNA